MKFAPLLLAALVASPAHAGMRYTIRNTFDGAGRGGPGNSTVQMTTDGQKARIAFTQGSPVGKGGYLVTQDGARTLTLVSPEDKTYMSWDMNAMMGMVGAMSAMMKMEVTDPKIEKLLDEPGPAILGYPTRHYKFRTAYAMSMTVMGFSSSTSVVREEESWTTTQLDTAALGHWIKQAPKTLNDSLDKLIRAEMDQMQGMPLKMLAVQTTTDNNGKVQTIKTVTEVTEIQELTPEPAAFEIPAGYRETKMDAGTAKGNDAGTDAAIPAGIPNLMKLFNK